MDWHTRIQKLQFILVEGGSLQFVESVVGSALRDFPELDWIWFVVAAFIFWDFNPGLHLLSRCPVTGLSWPGILLFHLAIDMLKGLIFHAVSPAQGATPKSGTISQAQAVWIALTRMAMNL